MKAFPAQHSIDGNWVKEPLEEYSGMDLRDYFAAKAMQGFLASWGEHDVTNFDDIAHDAYSMADAMMEARK